MKQKSWEKYEEVARQLLMHMRDKLDLVRVEGKQKLVGRETGTQWEVDAKGVRDSAGDIFVIVECRRYTNTRVPQDELAALAYKITDTGAAGGVIVSPLGIQEGAEKVARAENIHVVEIDADSTPQNFGMKFLNHIVMGVTSKATLRAEASASISRLCANCGERFPAEDSEKVCPSCLAGSA